MSAQKEKPTKAPLFGEFGGRAGHGQDNLVYNFNLPPYAREMAESGKWVVKVSHEGSEKHREIRNRSSDPTTAAIRGTVYKLHKYEILKHFLGDHIPRSMFLTASVTQENKERPVELTLQQKLPKFYLNTLTPEQQADPRLRDNVVDLMDKLKYMYSVVGEVNSRTSHGIDLDTKLDLGGLSDYVRGESIDHIFQADDAAKTIRKNTSKNIMVDPDTMQVYCVDFDQGEWEPGMSDAFNMVFEIDKIRQNNIRMVSPDLAHVAARGYLDPPLAS
jgi:hypothetical protein